ncbi:MAG: hypothetical protein SFU25_10210 [Candidatus Caenarcaniphilales bacterium]|nr:hypothetical protein [Candidatus Caenarcaniphilales bacterium]
MINLIAKNFILYFVLFFLISSCTQAKQKIVTEKIEKGQENKIAEVSDVDPPNLLFKTELNEEEKAFIRERATGFDERVKQYAINYGPKSTPEDSKKESTEMCKWILNNITELSTQPVSRERVHFMAMFVILKSWDTYLTRLLPNTGD